MPYLFKEKLDLRELAGRPAETRLVVVAEPQEDLLALYAYYLQNQEFTVRHCSRPEELPRTIEEFSPSLLIFNPKFYRHIADAVRFLRKLRSRFPFLPVVTVCEEISNQELKQLMSCGIASHVDRRFTKPGDIVVIAKTLLRQV